MFEVLRRRWWSCEARAARLPELTAASPPWHLPHRLYPKPSTCLCRAMRVCAAAYGLKKRGIGRGDRVCVICPNVPMILDMQQALPAIHAIPVLMNIRLTKPEVDYILEHSGSKMIIVDSEFKHLAEGFKGEVIVSNDSAGKDSSDPYEKLIAEGMQDAETKGWQGLTLIEDEEAGFNLCYTSGTTGR